VYFSLRENEEKTNTIQPPPSCVFLTFTTCLIIPTIFWFNATNSSKHNHIALLLIIKRQLNQSIHQFNSSPKPDNLYFHQSIHQSRIRRNPNINFPAQNHQNPRPKRPPRTKWRFSLNMYIKWNRTFWSITIKNSRYASTAKKVGLRFPSDFVSILNGARFDSDM